MKGRLTIIPVGNAAVSSKELAAAPRLEDLPPQYRKGGSHAVTAAREVAEAPSPTAGPLCCLCGLPYERMGNNPEPLSTTGRCCDACNEIVIEARINRRLLEEIERVEQALVRNWGAQDMAIAAICASRGLELLAEKQRLLATMKDRLVRLALLDEVLAKKSRTENPPA